MTIFYYKISLLHIAESINFFVMPIMLRTDLFI